MTHRGAQLLFGWLLVAAACGSGHPAGTDAATPDLPAGEDATADPGSDAPPPCPQPVLTIDEAGPVEVQTTLHLRGLQSLGAGDRPIASWQWTVEQPPQNRFLPVPSAQAAEPTHVPNVVGTYRYCLDVCDDSGACSDAPGCGTTACRTVEVVSGAAIHVELTWETDGDPDAYDDGPGAGSDLDLHFAHPFASGPDVDGDGEPDPWFDLPYDTFWFNPSPNLEGTLPPPDDDARLDRDDTDGWGPENVNLRGPEDGRTYRVGVHAWADNGFGPSVPRVRIFVSGQLAADRVLDQGLQRCDLWEVARIDWPSGAVGAVQHPDGSPRISVGYNSPSFVQVGGGSCP